MSAATTTRGAILVVDDERSMREMLALYLSRAGYAVESAGSAAEARRALKAKEHDLVITDLQMPDASGLEVLAECKKLHAETQVIVVTAYATAETAIAAMKAGAYDYLVKPFKLDEVGLVVERALERRLLMRQNVALRDEIKGRYRLDRLLGKSAAMQRVFDILRKIAPARTSVLLVGESGTGKELAARALHELSPRADHAFVAVNCGAIPETLIESELFGHVRGSFTGATADKEGLFEAAHGGTMMLDEVAELPLAMQVKLLRVLQERKVKPVGGVAEREVDVRVVAATNRDLETEVEKGTFRQDLYYRLNVIQVRMPPLRERREDVPLLVDHFTKKFAAEHAHPITGVDADAMAAITAHNFPGNVRELENLVERAVTLSSDGRITADALPDLSRADRATAAAHDLPLTGFDLEHELEAFERGFLLRALERTEGNRTLAARLLGISFRSLRYRLSKLGISGGEEPEGTGGGGGSGGGSGGGGGHERDDRKGESAP
jgi:two-component system, NtrC family, response regulator PilR